MSVYIISRCTENLVSIATDGRTLAPDDGVISREINRDDARKSHSLIDGVSMCLAGYVHEVTPRLFKKQFSDTFSSKGLCGSLDELKKVFHEVIDEETLKKMQSEATGTKYADLHIIAYEGDDIKIARVRIDRDEEKFNWTEEPSEFPFRVGGLSEAAELAILKMALSESVVYDAGTAPVVMNYLLEQSEKKYDTVGGERYLSLMTPTSFGDLNDESYVLADHLMTEIHDIVEHQKNRHISEMSQSAINMLADGIRTMHSFHPAAKLAEERLEAFVETNNKEFLQDAHFFLKITMTLYEQQEKNESWHKGEFIHGLSVPLSLYAKAVHLGGDKEEALKCYKSALQATVTPSIEGHRSKIRVLKGLRDLGDRSDREFAEERLEVMQEITNLSLDEIENIT